MQHSGEVRCFLACSPSLHWRWRLNHREMLGTVNFRQWTGLEPSDPTFGPERAGEWARKKAQRQRVETVTANWRFLSVALVCGLAATFLTVLLPSWLHQFAAGAWVATVFASLAFVVYQASGTMYLDSGAEAERWTAKELEPLQAGGWRIMNRVEFKNYDVDHVVVGPGGIWVIETKWTGDDRILDEKSARVRDAVRQIEGNARTVSSWLKSIAGPDAVRTAVVYWGPRLHPDLKSGPRLVSSTKVLTGSNIDSIFTSHHHLLAPDAIEQCWVRLSEYVTRQSKTKADEGPSLTEIAITVGVSVLSGLLAFVLASYLLSKVGMPLYWLVALGLATGSVFACRKVPRFRSIGLAFLTGSQMITLFLVVGYAYSLFQRS